MLAFLKRRWILLSCAGVLLACGGVDWRVFRLFAPEERALGVGAFEGALFFRIEEPVLTLDSCPPFQTHRMMLGSSPQYLDYDPGSAWSFAFRRGRVRDWSLPIWLPLATVIGWLCFRELRWREKRAKAANATQ